MKTNQWNRRFLQSMLLGLLLMFFGLFVVDSKAAEPELRMGVSTYSDFKKSYRTSPRETSVKNWRIWLKKRLAARIPGTGERPWTSSSIFRLMWVTAQNIQDIISLPTSIILHWMWSRCWDQKQKKSSAWWFMKPTAKSAIFLSVKTLNMTYWFWGNTQGEVYSSLDKNKI